MPDPVHVELLRRLAVAQDRSAALEEVAVATKHLLESTGRGLQLSDADMSNLELSDVDLRGAVLSRTVLHGAQLLGADLSGCTMICPGLERTDLSRANLQGAYIHAMAAQTTKFDGADLSYLRDATGSLFHGCSMRQVDLVGSHLAGSTFYQCDLTGAKADAIALQGATINECLLREVSLAGAGLSQVTVTKSSLSGAVLTQASGEGLVLQRLTDAHSVVLDNASLPALRVRDVRGAHWSARGLSATTSDWQQTILTDLDLTGADLTDARLAGCSWDRAKLATADLNGASILHSSLPQVDLSNAQGENLHIVESNLRQARLTDFTGRCVTMRDVDLADSDMRRANLYRSMLTGDPPRAMCMARADLTGAILVQAYVAADLRGAQLREINAAYSRFSQSDLSGADLSGAALYESTWVKVSCMDALVAGLKAPFFVDRCPGLQDAARATQGADSEPFLEYLSDFAGVLSRQRQGST